MKLPARPAPSPKNTRLPHPGAAKRAPIKRKAPGSGSAGSMNARLCGEQKWRVIEDAVVAERRELLRVADVEYTGPRARRRWPGATLMSPACPSPPLRQGPPDARVCEV